MPVTKDSPIYDPRKKSDRVRKEIVNTKPSEDSQDSQNQKKRDAKPVPGVFPARDFVNAVDRATELCKSLIKVKKEQKSKENLSGSYKRNAQELGRLMTGIVATIKNTASVVLDAQTRSGIIANAKLPTPALKAARQVLAQLSGSHRRIKALNADVAKEISKSQRGIEPKVILGYLPEIKDIFETANTARIDAEKLYKQWSQHVNPGAKLERRAGLEANPVLPKFKVHSKLVQPGEPKNKQEQKILDKIVMAGNLGGDAFPDPYTTLWKYYGDRDIKLDNDVRSIVRLAAQSAALLATLPKQSSILELYNNGDLISDTKAKFDGTKFNDNFNAVVGNLVKKMKTNEKVRDFVFKHDQRADDEKFNMAINHLSQKDSRGYSLIDNARKHYLDDCRKWFTTYLPIL